VAVQLLLVALFSVWFFAGMLFAQQRQSIAVWRSRGWSWRGVSMFLWTELAILALATAPVGVAAGWVASEIASRLAYGDQSLPAVHIDVLKMAPPVLAVLVAELIVLAGQAVLAGRHDALGARAAATRPPEAWWRRRYADIALAILAIPVLAQATLLGNASVRAAGAGGNIFDLVLPGLAIAAVALAALRILPLLATALGRARHTVAARLASMQLMRASSQHASLAVLLMLAVALGVFASTFAATATRNAADRAAYEVGGDIRGTFDGSLSTLPSEIPIAGAAARGDVFRGYAHQGTEDVPVLAIDPFTFKQVPYTRQDYTAMPLADLVQRLADGETGGLLLPAGASTLSMWAFGSNTGGSLIAHLTDVHGRPARADLGPLSFSGWKQLTGRLATDGGTVDARLRFRDLAVTGVSAPGELAFSDLAVDGRIVESFAEQIGGPGARFAPFLWWRSDWDTGSFAENLLPSMDLARDGQPAVAFRVVPAPIPTFIRPAATGRTAPGVGVPAAGPIPALAPSQMLSRFGLAVGKTIQVQVDNVAVTAVIVGVADHFPTLYPELGDFLVLARDPLLIYLAAGAHQRPWPNEIWVRTTAGGADAAVASMKAAPGFVGLYDRRSLEAASVHSPSQLGLESNLVLGFVAAAALGLLAFAVHFVLLGRARLSDYAVLEANGMDEGMLRRSLVIEQLVILFFCVLVGALLGVLASAVVLPGLQLSPFTADNAPPTIITFDVRLLGAVLGTVFAGAVAGVVIALAAAHPRVMPELRALG
jgi:hypothetical protein